MIILFITAVITLSAVEVIIVHDGDTMTIRHQGAEHRVRFRGIDTPEYWQPQCAHEKRLAAKARRFVWESLRAARQVTLGDVDKTADPYGRWLAWVYVDGENLAEMTIGAGLGRPYKGGLRNSWCD